MSTDGRQAAAAAPAVQAPEADLRAFSLVGRTALVTGVSRGIGRAIAVGLAGAGADLVLAGRAGSFDATKAAVEELGRTATTLDLDLSHPELIASGALDELLPADVDILVNNAGVIHREEALTVDASSWNEVLDVNLTSLFFLTQRIAGPMVARGRGKIINIASLLSFEGGIGVASYAASKHAVAGVTRALSNEWAPRGVQVNAIAPGYIVTDNTARLRTDPARATSIGDRIPAGRWGLPSDLVGAAVFLASRASDYVTGHVLLVDGGWSAR
ncbi:2-deoxy-D-gluconate 3-dehydrogenase [Jiangella alkaliphila]|uniref:2-deoxy-D-gluconate 3-dehydrogenase n=1 Tax=Jiangella alkaliphila TaxID=419479 RepID=A0A1H2LPR2_9ACTN|nr:SDR family oxidoreductase [Jiangella alkaliphila]SDU82980.1 2-deoxy-D-gluconate 3-dehydrogenase [Jiangella alkaliphila]